MTTEANVRIRRVTGPGGRVTVLLLAEDPETRRDVAVLAFTAEAFADAVLGAPARARVELPGGGPA